MARDILVNQHNHFDPTWRRCFDRPAEYNGTVVRSYAEVEALCIDAWLGLASRGYTYTEGQTVIWRKYLERRPERRAEIQAAARQGVFEMVLAGEVIPDSNLPAAEGLVRNFLLAMPFYHDLVGRDHPGLKIAWVCDAFGNGPNHPQILKGVGAEAAFALTYRRVEGPVWEGIDGTMIPVNDLMPGVITTGGYEKHPPCPSCRGRGCEVCGDTGMALAPEFPAEGVRDMLRRGAAHASDWVHGNVWTEELLPGPGLITQMEEFNREFQGRARARFATLHELYQRLQPVLAQGLAARTPGNPHDLNPAMPGCYVTRIRMKQRTRAAAYLLVAAEARLATEQWRRGAPAAPPPALDEAWRKVCFCQFHDAITGTHVDSAYAELLDMLDAAERAGREFVPAPPPAAAPAFTPLAEPEAHLRLGVFDLHVDRCGILALTVDGRDLCGPMPPQNRIRRPLRIGELVLDTDFGDAWGQRIAHFMPVSSALSVIPLGDFHTGVEVGLAAVRWHGVYTGGDPKVKTLAWTVTAALSDDGKRIDFTTDVDWDTGSRRLRVLFPVASREPSALWEVPYGSIVRTFDETKMNFSQWTANTMEFPALHWVRRDVDANSGVVLLNRGLPCYRWIPGMLDISLLRSPEWNFCAVEPFHYEFWDIDGQRDTGRHRFEYSLWPFTQALSHHETVRAGYAYNRPEPLELPFRVEGDVVVTAWKPAQDGSGWIVRMQEASGTGTTATLFFDRPMQVLRTNLIEEPEGEESTMAAAAFTLHKHGLLTVRIRP